MKKSSLLVFLPYLMSFLLVLAALVPSQAAKKYSQASGNWQTGSTWAGGVVPVAGDTVYILGAHTVNVVNDNLYSNSTYMFMVVMGTLDLTNNGKLNFNGSAKVIIENGGRILGNSNGDSISMAGGPAEYKGDEDGNITGPSYVGDNHSPVTGEGTAGCGCYSSVGSCVITSTDGYKVHISLTVKKLVKPASCVNGYNYNVQLDYAISFSGSNIPSGGLYTLQGNLTCGSQTLFFDLPNNGGVGTTTTNSNPWRGISDCSTATTVSLGCMNAVTDVHGSGINATTCSGTPTTLPVKLISFIGEKVEEGARLSWVTAMEKNFSYFEVERAQEDLVFQTIAQVEGKGGLDVETEYDYIDRSASNGKNYYRLKSIDQNGSSEYSDVVLVAFGGLSGGLSIYPTVIDQSAFNVEINNDEFSFPVTLTLLSSVGQAAFETDIETNASLVQLPSSVKPGVYVARLASLSGKQHLVRVVVK